MVLGDWPVSDQAACFPREPPWGRSLLRYFRSLCLQVTPGSLAANCGVQVGDVISAIGQLDARSMTHKDAELAVRGAGNSLELRLER